MHIALPYELDIRKALLHAGIFAEVENDGRIFFAEQLLDIFGVTFDIFSALDMVLFFANEIIIERHNAILRLCEFDKMRTDEARSTCDDYRWFLHEDTVPSFFLLFNDIPLLFCTPPGQYDRYASSAHQPERSDPPERIGKETGCSNLRASQRCGRGILSVRRLSCRCIFAAAGDSF